MWRFQINVYRIGEHSLLHNFEDFIKDFLACKYHYSSV